MNSTTLQLPKITIFSLLALLATSHPNLKAEGDKQQNLQILQAAEDAAYKQYIATKSPFDEAKYVRCMFESASAIGDQAGQDLALAHGLKVYRQYKEAQYCYPSQDDYTGTLKIEKILNDVENILCNELELLLNFITSTSNDRYNKILKESERLFNQDVQSTYAKIARDPKNRLPKFKTGTLWLFEPYVSKEIDGEDKEAQNALKAKILKECFDPALKTYLKIQDAFAGGKEELDEWLEAKHAHNTIPSSEEEATTQLSDEASANAHDEASEISSVISYHSLGDENEDNFDEDDSSENDPTFKPRKE